MTNNKALYLVTHPRSTSTALERAFMARTDLVCSHEPFGEPFYYGPERLSNRFDQEQVEKSGYDKVTFKDVVNELSKLSHAKRLAVKDMAQYIIPPNGKADIAPSLGNEKTSNKDDLNPTVLPNSILDKFIYVFLIRAPHLAVPSYYRCCIPPQSEMTGFDYFDPSEVGLRELRILFDYRRKLYPNEEILVIDSEDLIKRPSMVLQKICNYAHLEFTEDMLNWGDNSARDAKLFSKWPGFHDTALKSNGFSKTQPLPDTDDEDNIQEYKVDFPSLEAKWTDQYGSEGSKIISQTVKNNTDDYNYLRKFKAVF